VAPSRLIDLASVSDGTASTTAALDPLGVAAPKWAALRPDARHIVAAEIVQRAHLAKLQAALGGSAAAIDPAVPRAAEMTLRVCRAAGWAGGAITHTGNTDPILAAQRAATLAVISAGHALQFAALRSKIRDRVAVHRSLLRSDHRTGKGGRRTETTSGTDVANADRIPPSPGTGIAAVVVAVAGAVESGTGRRDQQRADAVPIQVLIARGAAGAPSALILPHRDQVAACPSTIATGVRTTSKNLFLNLLSSSNADGPTRLRHESAARELFARRELDRSADVLGMGVTASAGALTVRGSVWRRIAKEQTGDSAGEDGEGSATWASHGKHASNQRVETGIIHGVLQEYDARWART
jgi:hypothetical protein